MWSARAWRSVLRIVLASLVHPCISWTLLCLLVGWGWGCSSGRAADDDDAGDDDTDEPADDDDSSMVDMVTIHGGVEIITVGDYQPADEILVFQDDDPTNSTLTTGEEGDWYIDLPAEPAHAFVRAERDDLTDVMFMLDLEWQRDRVDHLVLFNPFVAIERARFFEEEFGFTYDSTKGLFHAGAVSRTQGTEYAGATVEFDLDYEASFAVDDELAPGNTTDTQGVLAFLNVEPGTTTVIVRGPEGNLCDGPNPVPIYPGIATHVVYLCD